MVSFHKQNYCKSFKKIDNWSSNVWNKNAKEIQKLLKISHIFFNVRGGGPGTNAILANRGSAIHVPLYFRLLCQCHRGYTSTSRRWLFVLHGQLYGLHEPVDDRRLVGRPLAEHGEFVFVTVNVAGRSALSVGQTAVEVGQAGGQFAVLFVQPLSLAVHPANFGPQPVEPVQQLLDGRLLCSVVVVVDSGRGGDVVVDDRSGYTRGRTSVAVRSRGHDPGRRGHDRSPSHYHSLQILVRFRLVLVPAKHRHGFPQEVKSHRGPVQRSVVQVRVFLAQSHLLLCQTVADVLRAALEHVRHERPKVVHHAVRQLHHQRSPVARVQRHLRSRRRH
uniref:Uncharacterized protein n=1 Tax=Schizaphis graminum TaxID=13262 RepID=A0A2S2PP10_SCHGA